MAARDSKLATPASHHNQELQNIFTKAQRAGTAINKESALFSNCGLFSRLPSEIRLEIYKHVLWDGRMWDVEGDPYYDPNDSDDSEGPPPVANITGNSFHSLSASEPLIPRICDQPNLIAILLTCRWIYLESVSLLYTTNTDYFKAIGNLETLHHVAQDASPRAFGLFRVDGYRWRHW